MLENLQQVDAATFDTWVAEQPEERRFELINGGVFEKAMVTKDDHGKVVSEFVYCLLTHSREHDIDGYVTGETSGYQFGDQRFIPDVALILNQSLTHQAYSDNLPTLVIEVISDPTNTTELSTLEDKREVYLAAGVALWETNTEKRFVDVYTPDGRYHRVRDILNLDALPGLAIPLDRVFR